MLQEKIWLFGFRFLFKTSTQALILKLEEDCYCKEKVVIIWSGYGFVVALIGALAYGLPEIFNQSGMKLEQFYYQN
jgi:hypothetical protein